MKKIIILLAFFLTFAGVSAQGQMPTVPTDKDVKIGKLENGLTYYIRHNEEPKGQANFYIAQKVGSILEEEEQRGLAHFLEHMCFNGTEKFPGNRIIKYCESIGVKFGTNLNAYTSMDETVYNINNVPVAKIPEAMDSCLWILHDWADGLLLTDEDIDQERGVIHEEWRSRRTAQMRMLDSILVKIYPGNRYAERMPIGVMSVVDNFPYKALRDYYEKWYRPDLQGIIVVGDVDVDAVEGKIKEIFGTIKAQENPAERVYFPVEDNQEPLIALAKDKECPNAITMISFKHDCFPDSLKNTMAYIAYDYIAGVTGMMLQSRLNEMLQNPQPPFLGASIRDEEFLVAKTKSAFTGYAVSDDKTIASSSAAVYREMLRAAKHGFTETEYARAKAELLSSAETEYNQREKKDNEFYGRKYASNFTDGEPIVSLADRLALMKKLTESIPLEAINQTVASLVGDKNMVIVGMYPDKEGETLPTDAEMLAALKAVEAEEIAAYVDKVSDEPLISKEPKAGKVKKTSEAPFGYTKYTLSNGVEVYLKTTDFNKDEIVMRAYSEGGTSLYPDSEATNLKVLGDVMDIGGVGNFNTTALTKALAGKNISITTKIGSYSESVSGNSTPKDFETLLQLNYLYFTALRKDDDAFASWKTRTEAEIRNEEAEPSTALKDSLYKAIMANDVRVARLKTEELDNVDYDRILQIARERFANAADFKFIFTGNISDTAALPLIEKYIGSLPSSKSAEKADTTVNRYAKGEVSKIFSTAMETPMVTNYFLDNGRPDYSFRKNIAYRLAIHSLSIELYEQIREKEGGTYGVSARGDMSATPYPEATLTIAYMTSPDKYEYLNGRIKEIVEQFGKEGPKPENMDKGKKYFIKKYQENIRQNGYFTGAMLTYLTDGIDIVDGYESMVESITIEEARQAFMEIQSQNNHAKVIQVGTAK